MKLIYINATKHRWEKKSSFCMRKKYIFQIFYCIFKVWRTISNRVTNVLEEFCFECYKKEPQRGVNEEDLIGPLHYMYLYENIPQPQYSPLWLTGLKALTDTNQPSLPTPFSAQGIYFCLDGPFNCILFHNFFRQVFTFSFCCSSLISALLNSSIISLLLKVSLLLRGRLFCMAPV